MGCHAMCLMPVNKRITRWVFAHSTEVEKMGEMAVREQAVEREFIEITYQKWNDR